MSSLTETQAHKQARDLRKEFNDHKLIAERRSVAERTRAQDDILAAAGISNELVNVLPWESEIPNQEMDLYAGTLALAAPEPKVFVQSEKAKKQETGELLERVYDACITLLFPDDYDIMRYLAQDGTAVRRLDELDRWYTGRPKRKKGEEPEQYLERQDAHARGVTLPFALTDVDPADFYYLLDRQKREVEFGCEYTSMRESEAKPDGDFEKRGELIVVRDRETIRHFWSEGESQEGTQIWEGENRFRIADRGHTGYFLYRGRFSGFKDPERRYSPFALVSLNIAQHLGFWMTLHGALMVQSLQAWLEKDVQRVTDTTVPGRTAAVEKKAKNREANTPRGGAIVAEFAVGEHVKFREMTENAGRMVDHLMTELEMYRFRDTLIGEASGSDESGRSFIRRQEAAGRQLARGYRERELRTEEILRVITSTLFHRPEYLGGKNSAACIYIPHMVEDAGDDGTIKKEDLLELRAEHNVPHDLRVAVESKSDAGQLAWSEEGLKMEGHIPSDIIDVKYYGSRDPTLWNRLRVKDMVRAQLLPAAIQDGVERAIAEVKGAPLDNQPVVMPDDAAQPPQQMPAQPAAIPSGTQGSVAAQPTPTQPEDAGMALSANGAGLGY